MGGKLGGGAQLTGLGREILRQYRALQADVANAADGAPQAAMLAALRDQPRARQQEG